MPKGDASRCQSCQADNPAGAARCEACGARLGPKPRRRGGPEDLATPFSAQADPRDREAQIAYRVCVYGLIPGLGLLLGPLALLLGLRTRWRYRHDAEPFKAAGTANAAVLLGSLLALTNWAGLVLMVLGLRS
jgi:hypothetical protein